MLNIYCQYSFGGYKIFWISQSGIREVTVTDSCHLPLSAVSFFSHDGLKMVLTMLPEKQLLMQINDISVADLDEIGRKKNMSMQFIASDRTSAKELCNLAAVAASDLSLIERFLASLIMVDVNLNFDYDKLLQFMQEIRSNPCICDKPLDRVQNRKAPLFIYFGETFRSSIADYKELVPMAMQTRAVKLHWNTDKHCPEEMSGISVVGDFIKRIIDKLGLWKNL